MQSNALPLVQVNENNVRELNCVCLVLPTLVGEGILFCPLWGENESPELIQSPSYSNGRPFHQLLEGSLERCIRGTECRQKIRGWCVLLPWALLL